MPDHLGGTDYTITEPHGFCKYCQRDDQPTFPSRTGSPICRDCKVQGRDT